MSERGVLIYTRSCSIYRVGFYLVRDPLTSEQKGHHLELGAPPLRQKAEPIKVLDKKYRGATLVYREVVR